jgi:DNA-3-methyladenine glycosylase II
LRVGAGEDQSLILEILSGPLTNSQKKFVKDYVKAWFDLDTDLKPFYKLASGDPLLAGLVKEHYGYRIVGQPDLFESLVWAILGQQINVQFAYTLKQRFVERYGEQMQYKGETFYLFPTPREVSNVPDADLLALQFSRQKSRYTLAVAEAFASGKLSQEQLSNLSLAEARTRLVAIKGIGNWTANYALMKTFRFPDAFPREDVGIHNAIKRLKSMERKPTLGEVDEIFGRYAGWEAYATLYLWKAL